MKLAIPIKLDDETLSLLRSIDFSLKRIAGTFFLQPELGRPREAHSGRVVGMDAVRKPVGEDALSVSTDEFIVTEEMKDKAREMGYQGTD